MAPGLDGLQEAVYRLFVTLALMSFALLGLAGLLEFAAPPLARRAAAWLRARRRRPETTFYVGRFEALRAVVYVVGPDGMRSLFEARPAPRRWAEVGERLAEAIAADALAGGPASRRGPRRIARRLGRFPLDGFILERRAATALAGRSLRRRSAYRVLAAASHLRTGVRRTVAIAATLAPRRPHGGEEERGADRALGAGWRRSRGGA